MTKYKIEDAVQYRTENPAIKNAIKIVADADGTMLATGMSLAGGELAKLVALANLGAAFYAAAKVHPTGHISIDDREGDLVRLIAEVPK